MMYGARSPRSRAACDVVELALAEHRRAHGAGDDRREDERRSRRSASPFELPSATSASDRDHDQRQREHGVDDRG